jgi:hypothetical protein
LDFSPRNPDDLAAKVEWAWAHSREMAAMGRAAHAECEGKFTAEINHTAL